VGIGDRRGGVGVGLGIRKGEERARKVGEYMVLERRG